MDRIERPTDLVGVVSDLRHHNGQLLVTMDSQNVQAICIGAASKPYSGDMRSLVLVGVRSVRVSVASSSTPTVRSRQTSLRTLCDLIQPSVKCCSTIRAMCGQRVGFESRHDVASPRVGRLVVLTTQRPQRRCIVLSLHSTPQLSLMASCLSRAKRGRVVMRDSSALSPEDSTNAQSTIVRSV